MGVSVVGMVLGCEFVVGRGVSVCAEVLVCVRVVGVSTS